MNAVAEEDSEDDDNGPGGLRDINEITTPKSEKPEPEQNQQSFRDRDTQEKTKDQRNVTAAADKE